MGYISVNIPSIGERERELLCECIDTGWISSEGPFVAQLEQAMAAHVGRKHGVAVANGTAALEVAVASLDLPRGSEVILPTFTIISCAAAIVRAGLVPITVDADAETWNMNVDEVARAISPKTSAIMVVHIYGLPVDMNPILKLAEDHGLRVIEDAAQAIGVSYEGIPCGRFGDISTFSFYPNKLITTGEGGMILTDSDELAQKCAWLRNLCFDEKRFVHERLGWNYRMSNLQAAVGVAQLEQLTEHIKKKRDQGHLYAKHLSSLKSIRFAPSNVPGAENLYWVFGVVLGDESPVDAQKMQKSLGELGIGTRPFFWPMHEQPVFRKLGLFSNVSHPVAENLARRGFYLPSGMGLENSAVQQAARALKDLLS